jgi:hypothetical protein
MIANQKKMNSLLEEIIGKLDILPSKYQQAVEHYESVGKWLDEDNFKLQPYNSTIFPQGSFRLGTVIRPWRDGKDADYDIDLVCRLEINKNKIEMRI